jgi:hypothetical protein
MNRDARRIPALAVALLAVGMPLRAQSIEIGERLTISSSILGEQRDLLVHLPESYATSSFRYPVLYVLAGRPEEARPYLRRAYELAVELGLPDVEDYRESLERAEE